MKKSQRRATGYNETIIANAIRLHANELIRVQLQPRNNVDGYAVEVTREIFGEEYSYVGWISMYAFKHEPWPIDQRHMIDRAFATTVQEVIKAKGN